jgi:hypothetical protein
MSGKQIFICAVFILIMAAFCIGLLSGFVILKIEDQIDRHNYNNLLIIYGE